MTFAELLVKLPAYIEVALQVVGAAAVVAAAIPGVKDDAAVGVAKKVLLTLKSIANILGANFGAAKNLESASKEDIKKLAAKLQIKD